MTENTNTQNDNDVISDTQDSAERNPAVALSDGYTVPKPFLDEIHTHIKERLPQLVPEKHYTAKNIYGKELWGAMDGGSQRLIGRCIAYLDTEGTSDYLFINRKTKKPFSNIHKIWERLRKAAGLPNLRLHDLRHFYASVMVSSGRTLYEVQQILGHSDPKVTMRYSHVSSKSLQDAANSASVIIKGAMETTT